MNRHVNLAGWRIPLKHLKKSKHFPTPCREYIPNLPLNVAIFHLM